MNNYIVSAFCGCLFVINSFSQTKSIGGFLNEIEQNNNELKAYQTFIEGKILKNKTENNLPDPEISGYYLPYGDNTTKSYFEYQISQSFEFPTVYAARNKWNKTKFQQFKVSYLKKRQEVLLDAKKVLIHINYLHKQKGIEIDRRAKSKMVYNQIQELFKNEQVGILDLNKAKISWIQNQFKVQQIENEIQNLVIKIETLNGGKSLLGMESQFIIPLKVEALDVIWQSILLNEPELKELKLTEEISFRKITLEKNKVLPNLALGYNFQGVNGNNYSGYFGGLSIPLWSSKNKVKAALTNYKYEQSNTKVKTELYFMQFQKTFKNYQLTLGKYSEYQKIMTDLNSEELLFKAYNLGEYSFIEFYVELQFYQEAADKMLQMEKELKLLRAKLLKHQL